MSTSPLAGVASLTRPSYASPRRTADALLESQKVILQLFQFFLSQQQQKQLGRPAVYNSDSSAQVPFTSSATMVTPLNTMATVGTTPSLPPHDVSQQVEKVVPEEDIQNTVLDNFFAENPVSQAANEGRHFNTSSDTVNKLLRGLCSLQPSESVKKLSQETSDVLPTFAKALGQSFLSTEGSVAEDVDCDFVSKETTDVFEEDHRNEIDQGMFT